MRTVTVGAAQSEITKNADGTTSVRVTRSYAASANANSAERVWQIVADFASIKTIFPSVLRVYVTYPDGGDTKVGTVRDMTFAPADATKPLAATNPLNLGVEQLETIEPNERRLEYISVPGQPVTGYHSVMEVGGDDACTLTWASTFTLFDPQKNEKFPGILAGILAGGANQIATALGLD